MKKRGYKLCFINIHQVNFPPISGLAQKLLSSHLSGTMDRLPITPSLENDKLQEELTERTVEISRMRDQMSQQQNELEEVRSKLKNHEATKNSFDAVTHELVSTLHSVVLYNGLVHLYFLLNFSFPLFLCMLMYGNVHKNKGKLKLNWNKNKLQHIFEY